MYVAVALVRAPFLAMSSRGDAQEENASTKMAGTSKIPFPIERGEPGNTAANLQGDGKDHVTRPASGSWLEVATDYVDTHLRGVRTIPWLVGALGVLLVVRYGRVVSDVQYHCRTII